jgi:hypothetical protein
MTVTRLASAGARRIWLRPAPRCLPAPLTPWIARARLARISRRRGRPVRPDEHVNWQVWGHSGPERRPLAATEEPARRSETRSLAATGDMNMS